MQAFAHARQQRMHALEIGRDAGAVAAAVRAHAQVFLDREAGEDAAAFRHQRDAAAHALVGGQRVDARAGVADLAGERLDAGQRVQRARLACAVGADQADQFARAQFEVDAAYRAHPVVGDVQVADLQQGRRRLISAHGGRLPGRLR